MSTMRFNGYPAPHIASWWQADGSSSAGVTFQCGHQRAVPMGELGFGTVPACTVAGCDGQPKTVPGFNVQPARWIDAQGQTYKAVKLTSLDAPGAPGVETFVREDLPEGPGYMAYDPTKVAVKDAQDAMSAIALIKRLILGRP